MKTELVQSRIAMEMVALEAAVKVAGDAVRMSAASHSG